MIRAEVATWPAEAVAEWHERVGMRLEHLRQPWPTDDARRAETEAGRELVRSGRVEALRRREGM